MARPWTPEDDQRLRDLHATGKSLHAIAQEMSRGKATVSGQSKALGLSWAREQVHAATTAKVRDAKARRAAALEAELEILELAQARVLDAMRRRSSWRTVMRGEGGAEHTDDLDFVPSRDLRDETSSRNAMAGIIAKLDTDDNGATEARSMLERLADTLGVTGPEQ